MISLLDINQFTAKLQPVKAAELFSRQDEFHQDGLLSERIFGVENSKERKTTFAYIDLNTAVIHPTAYDILSRLDRKIQDFISTEKTFSVDQNGFLREDDSGVTGLPEFIKLFPKIKFRGESDSRNKLIKVIENSYRAGTLFITRIPVIPVEYRSAYKDQQSGEWVIDKLNELYQGIIRRSTQASRAGSGPLADLLIYSLQIAVRNYNTYIRSKIEKKSGLIRQQMLGKRVDFSARAVITPNPNLKANEVGIPMRMAITLFEPFILHKILHTNIIDHKQLESEIKSYLKLELSIDSIQKVMKGIKNGDKIPQPLYDLFVTVTEAAIHDRVVMVKRDPVLHTASYLGYKPILHHGATLELSTLNVGPHTADFDGDSNYLNLLIKSDFDKKIKKVHIKDLLNEYKFKFKDSKIKTNGIVVTHYIPEEKLEVKAIDPNTGNVEYKEIKDYSIHENIQMYKIHDKQYNRFEDFWLSYDHSAIIYDEHEQIIKKISPRELLENPKGKYLIKEKRE